MQDDARSSAGNDSRADVTASPEPARYPARYPGSGNPGLFGAGYRDRSFAGTSAHTGSRPSDSDTAGTNAFTASRQPASTSTMPSVPESFRRSDANTIDASTIGGGAGTSGAIVIGSASEDIVRGSAGDDFIFADGGRDTVLGGEGDDIVQGGRGNDILAGQDGDDIIGGGAGDDLVLGGRGNDTLMGGSGVDTVGMAGKPSDYDIIVSRGPIGGEAFGESFLFANRSSGELDRVEGDVEKVVFGNGPGDSSGGTFDIREVPTRYFV